MSLIDTGHPTTSLPEQYYKEKILQAKEENENEYNSLLVKYELRISSIKQFIAMKLSLWQASILFFSDSFLFLFPSGLGQLHVLHPFAFAPQRSW